MQKIKRKDLLEIYNNVCDSWKEEITKLVLFQTTDEIEVSNDLIEKAFNKADVSQKKILKKYFELPENNLEKIKSFKDILKISGKKLSEVVPFNKPKGENQVKINALAKIMLIEEVLNEGWKPDWKDPNQYKYYPYFIFNNTGLVFYDYGCHSCLYGSVVAFYKNRDIVNFVGNTFIKEYEEFITGIIQK